MEKSTENSRDLGKKLAVVNVSLKAANTRAANARQAALAAAEENASKVATPAATVTPTATTNVTTKRGRKPGNSKRDRHVAEIDAELALGDSTSGSSAVDKEIVLSVITSKQVEELQSSSDSHRHQAVNIHDQSQNPIKSHYQSQYADSLLEDLKSQTRIRESQSHFNQMFAMTALVMGRPQQAPVASTTALLYNNAESFFSEDCVQQPSPIPGTAMHTHTPQSHNSTAAIHTPQTHYVQQPYIAGTAMHTPQSHISIAAMPPPQTHYVQQPPHDPALNVNEH